MSQLKIPNTAKWMRQQNRESAISEIFNSCSYPYHSLTYLTALKLLTDQQLYTRYRFFCHDKADSLLAELEMDLAEFILLTEL